VSATADYIREAREQKGLTLGQAAESTRIPQYYLEILEGGGNDRLVSDRLYMVHFLRTYAAYLEIEVETLAAQFVRENRAADALPTPPAKEPRSRKAATVAFLFVLLMIAAGVYVYDPTLEKLLHLVRTFTERPTVEAPPDNAREVAVTPSLPASAVPQTPLPSTEPNSVLQPEADETAPVGAEQVRSLAGAVSEPAAVPEPSTEPVETVSNDSAAPSDSEPAQTDVPREVASAPAVEQTPASQRATEETAAASETAEGTEPPAQQTQPDIATASTEPVQADGAAAASTHTLTIAADARSWLRVWVDDRPSRDFMLDPGQSATLSADTGFTITFGNAGGVRLTLNEEELPAVGTSGQVVRNYKLPRPEQATP